ncbi:glycosyltransferase family 2 protein [Olsenella urininfantis]|uniref:glycosyltransferase family 2 protein n=1 Tax=Olsenella urininfantis TaxID=1871033 RepID=UPI000BE9CBE5|nr:glycosyltransferase family A protein [Olsenella urininfantis]
MGKVSVVVPVYNVEDYLDGCLESLEAQTYRDLEIICVNDGSTDGSEDKLRQWAERDGRVRVICQSNAGPSAARNAGIRAATGDFICFLDPDDRFLPSACEEIHEALSSADTDVLVFGATYIPASLNSPWLDYALSPRDVEYTSFSTDVLFKEQSRPFVWRLALKASFLAEQGLRFDEELPFGEDQVFCFAVYPRSSHTVFISKKLYEYRAQRPGSLMDQRFKDLCGKMLEHADVLEHIYADWERLGILEKYCSQMVSWGLDFALTNMLRAPQDDFIVVAQRLSGILRRFFTEDSLRKIDVKADRNLALNLFRRPQASVFLRKKAAWRFFGARYGRKLALRWVFSRYHLDAS